MPNRFSPGSGCCNKDGCEIRDIPFADGYDDQTDEWTKNWSEVSAGVFELLADLPRDHCRIELITATARLGDFTVAGNDFTIELFDRVTDETLFTKKFAVRDGEDIASDTTFIFDPLARVVIAYKGAFGYVLGNGVPNLRFAHPSGTELSPIVVPDTGVQVAWPIIFGGTLVPEGIEFPPVPDGSGETWSQNKLIVSDVAGVPVCHFFQMAVSTAPATGTKVWWPVSVVKPIYSGFDTPTPDWDSYLSLAMAANRLGTLTIRADTVEYCHGATVEAVPTMYASHCYQNASLSEHDRIGLRFSANTATPWVESVKITQLYNPERDIKILCPAPLLTQKITPDYSHTKLRTVSITYPDGEAEPIAHLHRNYLPFELIPGDAAYIDAEIDVTHALFARPYKPFVDDEDPYYYQCDVVQWTGGPSTVAMLTEIEVDPVFCGTINARVFSYYLIDFTGPSTSPDHVWSAGRTASDSDGVTIRAGGLASWNRYYEHNGSAWEYYGQSAIPWEYKGQSVIPWVADDELDNVRDTARDLMIDAALFWYRTRKGVFTIDASDTVAEADEIDFTPFIPKVFIYAEATMGGTMDPDSSGVEAYVARGYEAVLDGGAPGVYFTNKFNDAYSGIYCEYLKVVEGITKDEIRAVTFDSSDAMEGADTAQAAFIPYRKKIRGTGTHMGGGFYYNSTFRTIWFNTFPVADLSFDIEWGS